MQTALNTPSPDAIGWTVWKGTELVWYVTPVEHPQPKASQAQAEEAWDRLCRCTEPFDLMGDDLQEDHYFAMVEWGML